MKQWTVTYREKSGSKTSVVIEAEDRAGVFAELKNRGINAISITEGAVKAKRSATSGGVSNGVWGVVATLVVVALAGVVWMVMPKEEKLEVVKEPKTKVKTVNSTTSISEKPKVPNSEESGEDCNIKTPDKGADGDKKFAEPKPRAQLPGTKERIEASVARGEKARFKHTSENFLAHFAVPGEVVPPVPITPMMKEDFERSLNKPIEILPTDTDEEVAIKEIVAGMKQEASQYIKEGGSLDQYFAMLFERQKKESDYRTEANSLVVKMVMEGDDEGAYLMWGKLNEDLSSKGIKTLVLPPMLKRFQVEQPLP